MGKLEKQNDAYGRNRNRRGRRKGKQFNFILIFLNKQLIYKGRWGFSDISFASWF